MEKREILKLDPGPDDKFLLSGPGYNDRIFFDIFLIMRVSKLI